MITTLSYDFCSIDIYENYLIVVMNEGITVKPEHNTVLEKIANNYYSNKRFGYIKHRIHSYSVDPRIYFEKSKINNLVAFAVVSNQKINLMNTELEKKFFDKPFKHFSSLKEAIQWVELHLNKEHSN